MQPILDNDFIPAIKWTKNFLADASIPVSVAVERENSLTYRYDTRIGKNQADNEFYIERLVKMLLWTVGGFKIYINRKELAAYLSNCYSDGGLRSFDKKFMERVYEKPFQIIFTDDVPATKGNPQAIGRNLSGSRVGFDAGGSDMKVSAVKDGEVVFSEEIVWLPKLNENPAYHYENIREAIKRGAERLGGKIDAIGVSSAGIYIGNRTMVASLFLKIPQEQFDAQIKDIYINIAREFGVSVRVANDGDVAALAGSMCLEKNGVLGIAMGTSEAVGYVDQSGKITGWLNELAFAPADYNTKAIRDEWSGDYGVGCKYFSQDAVIKLAGAAGIDLPDNLTLAEKLKVVQKLVNEGHEGARQIFETIGVYFGYAIAYYAEFYDINYLQVLGRVTSGIGGDLIIENANRVLLEEFSELAQKVTLYVPDEYERRVGQAIAAASL
ncbi:MAG: ROK family protein [Clostridiales bacterium]|jgi:predicted NBD/HSP70 family sugar kinase|nr:ROK family protein [Clostridiales bacterium]